MRIARFFGRLAGTGALLGVAFVGGVGFQDLRTVHDLPSLRTVLSVLPARLGNAVFLAAHGQGSDYSPYQTYADVLKTIQENYYGVKQVGGHTGSPGLTLKTNEQDQIAVAKVLPGGTAQRAGVRAGDVIAKIDGKPSPSEADAAQMLWGEPDTTVTLSLVRKGAPLTLTVPRAVIPKDVDTTVMTYNGVRGMMGSLKDKYTMFLDPAAYTDMRKQTSGEFVGIGALLGTNKLKQVYIVRVLPNGPASRSKLMAGDIILKVDGHTALKKPDTDVVRLIRGEPNTSVTLTVLRRAASKVVTIPRGVVHQELVQHAMIDPKHRIGYISLAEFDEDADLQINKAMTDLQAQGMRGLILDLRGNPGGLLDVAEQIASRFIPSGPVVWTKERTQTLETMKHDDVNPEIHKQHPRYPLVVLVDGGSASASEILSGAIKDTKAGVLIGEKTYGKGVVQSILPLPDGSAARITTQHYYTARKNDINHKGIEPDIHVKFTDEQQRLHAAFQREHPEANYDVKNDPQLKRGLSELTQKLQVASAGPRPWSD